MVTNSTRPGDLIGYARVSTWDQNADLQVDALTEIGCTRIFTDHASGTRTDRPQLAAALDYARPGDTLVVWRLDRLGRSLRHLVETVSGFEEAGIGFRSLNGDIDTTTSNGRLIFHIFCALAEFERDLLVERTQAGLSRARAEGKSIGRPGALTQSQREDVIRKLEAGASIAALAREYATSRQTILRARAASTA